MNFALPVTSSVGSWPVGKMPISGPLIGQPWAKSSVAPEAVGGAEGANRPRGSWQLCDRHVKFQGLLHSDVCSPP